MLKAPTADRREGRGLFDDILKIPERATGLDDPTGEQVENYDSLEARCNGWDVSGGNGGWAFPWEWRWSINLDPRVDDVGAVSLHFPTFDLPALIARLNGWSA